MTPSPWWMDWRSYRSNTNIDYHAQLSPCWVTVKQNFMTADTLTRRWVHVSRHFHPNKKQQELPSTKICRHSINIWPKKTQQFSLANLVYNLRQNNRKTKNNCNYITWQSDNLCPDYLITKPHKYKIQNTDWEKIFQCISSYILHTCSICFN